MASFRVDGLTALVADLDALATMPESVQDGMLNAGADVIIQAQKDEAGKMLGDGGTIGNALRKKKPGRKDGARSMSITFDGIARGKRRPKTGNRIAEIAFVNEFGKAGQPARPFILTANEKSADEAARKAAQVYDNYLKSKNL